MAKYLQALLGAQEPLFSHDLKRLEASTGNRAIDVKLVGDIHAAAHTIMRGLGLDPADTTPEELYKALQAKGVGEYSDLSAHYTGLVTKKGIISFNENDIKRNKTRSFAERKIDSMQQVLIQELADRYWAHGAPSEHIQELIHDSAISTLNVIGKKKGNK